jgi:hypothetical protein
MVLAASMCPDEGCMATSRAPSRARSQYMARVAAPVGLDEALKTCSTSAKSGLGDTTALKRPGPTADKAALLVGGSTVANRPDGSTWMLFPAASCHGDAQ